MEGNTTMKKKFKAVGLIAALTMGLTLFTGCSKDGKVNQDDMVEKYAGYCELGEYKGVEYVASNIEVTDEVLEAEINYLLSAYATEAESTTGVAEVGDKVNIDFIGSVDGVEFEGGSSEGMGYDLTLGSGTMIDGFEEQIAGHKAGETFNIEVTFPEDYGKEDLNGKDAVFQITINTVTEMVLPEYNDEFVSTYTYFATTEELENAIRENYAENDKNINRATIIEIIMDNTTIKEYPQKELEKLIDETMTSVEEEAAGYGMDMETYIATLYGISTLENFEIYIGGLAEDFLDEKIVICAIAEAEGIRATDEEIDAKKAEMMESLNLSEEELYKVYSKEDVMYYALADNVYDFLLENASPTD